MSLILNPQNYFTVVRQINNHTDTATYYVKAVIRNAYTDTIIDTLQLTDKGGQRFKKDWLVPADPSGQGFYISIVTSVYTDSGYTTKSENYGDDENTYLIQDRVINRGGGGDNSLDMVSIRQAIREEIANIPKVTEKWEEILLAIANLDIPKDNTKQIIDEIKKISKQIKDKEVTPKTDLTPILDYLKNDEKVDISPLLYMVDNVEARVKNLQQDTKVIQDILEVEQGFLNRISGKQEIKRPVKFDINQLSQ